MLNEKLAKGVYLNGDTFSITEDSFKKLLKKPFDLIPYTATEYLLADQTNQKEKTLDENYRYPYLYGQVFVVNKDFLKTTLNY